MLQELLYFIFIRVISEVGIVNNGVKKITVFEVRRQRRNGISLVDMFSTHPPILSLLVTLHCKKWQPACAGIGPAYAGICSMPV
jgi:hypothetical protein